MTLLYRLQVATRETIAREVAEQMASLAQAAFAARDLVTIAISGGSVAESCLPVLANAALPWRKVHIFWCDERAVPLSSSDSNAGRAMELWHGSRLASEAMLHPVQVDDATTRERGPERDSELDGFVARAARAYEEELTGIAGSPPLLDVVLLGVGEDGHVASLFPETGFAPEASSVLAVTDSPKPPSRRVTLSMDTIARARHAIIVAYGNGKAQALREAMTNPRSSLPVARVLQQSPDVRVFLDSDAASLLRDGVQHSTQ